MGPYSRRIKEISGNNFIAQEKHDYDQAIGCNLAQHGVQGSYEGNEFVQCAHNFPFALNSLKYSNTQNQLFGS
jgi:hypothetical protein